MAQNTDVNLTIHSNYATFFFAALVDFGFSEPWHMIMKNWEIQLLMFRPQWCGMTSVS